MQRFNTLLDQPDLRAFNKHTQEAQMAQKIWMAVVPNHLAQHCHANGIKNKQITVFANNNSVAAKIKLLIPSLLINLEKQGCEVTSICLKVQVKSTPTTQPKAIRKLSSSAAKNVKQLADNLSGTPLGDVLGKLAKRT